MIAQQEIIDNVRPGAVWITRMTFLQVFSDFFGVDPDVHEWREKRDAYEQDVSDRGGAILMPHNNAYYHPGAWRFGMQRKRGHIFGPHDIEKRPAHYHCQPNPWEQRSYHRRDTNGTAPRSIGQYMIDPDILEQIGRGYVYDIFLERRKAFDPRTMIAKRNDRMWEWRDVLREMTFLPVFDRENVRRAAHVDHIDLVGGGDEDREVTAKAVDNHVRKWITQGKVVQLRHGLYKTVGEVYNDYVTFGDHYLVDWFYEFLRRQAGRQRANPGVWFDLQTILDDAAFGFHKEWHLYGKLPTERIMRLRLNKNTKGMAGEPRENDWLQKVGTGRLELTPEAVRLFCPDKVRNYSDS
jgi:hypothetical protein